MSDEEVQRQGGRRGRAFLGWAAFGEAIATHARVRLVGDQDGKEEI
jgi:hypothetical protein